MNRIIQKKYYIFIMTIILLTLFLLFTNGLEQKEKKEKLAEKIEELGTDEFKLVLWDASFFSDGEQEIEIKWWFNDANNLYYFFLPSSISGRLCYVFNQYDSVLIDKNKVLPGDTFNLETGRHLLQLDSGEQITIEIMCSENIASMFMTTDSGDLSAIHESKENEDSGNYVLFDAEGNINCDGKLSTIRGRGNMTFDAADKKSYAIKMQEKTAVLDLGIAKGWSLLANAFDESLIRNQMVTQMAKEMRMEYVADMTHVDLYINGEYQGDYQLAEKVEIAEERLNIRNLEKEMEELNPDIDFVMLESTEEPVGDFPAIKWVENLNVPENIETGYLLELDMTYRYYEEQSGFITSRKQPVVIKSPKCVSYEQVFYLANKYQELEDALCAPDGFNEDTGLYYYDYLDLDTFAQKYLLDEVSKNLDAALTSFFMYIPENDTRFYVGPIWDYDRTFGVDFERCGIDLKDPVGFYVSENIYYEEADVNIFYLLCQQEEFSELYKKMYFEEVRDIVQKIAEETGEENAKKIESSAMMDAVRWDSFESGMDVEINRKLFYENVEAVKSFIEKRIVFLDEAWK